MSGSRTTTAPKGIEDYRAGYPQFAALLSSHPAFQNVRRFTRARMRLLLHKQDEVAVLEENLDQIDSEENCELFLGCIRRDTNSERRDVLKQLTLALGEYDVLIERSSTIMSLPSSKSRDLKNLKKWVRGTACITRTESAFLDHAEDALNLTGSSDSAVTFIEDGMGDALFWVERCYRRMFPTKCMRRKNKLTSNEHLFLPSDTLYIISRILTTCTATVILLTPILILCKLTSLVGRLITIALSACFFLSTMSLFTRAKTVEIFTAGASYAAVLVVFTSANNVPSLGMN